jgi:hypothetical protein
MDENANQQQLLSNSSEHINNVTIIDETLLTDDQPEQIQEIPSVTRVVLEWTTDMLSEVRKYDALYFEYLKFIFDRYVEKAIHFFYVNLLNIVDKQKAWIKRQLK